nr:response regulator [uncultured Marinobacter sp.]
MRVAQFAPTVLVADDDPDDRLMIQEAFEERVTGCRLYFVEDGAELMEYLRKTYDPTDTSGNQCPNLILLDLNMPLKDGRQALREIKSNPDFRAIPTVILSTSQNEDDIAACYDLGANSYIVKPASYSDLLGITDTLRQYWMDTVELSIKRERHDKYRP